MNNVKKEVMKNSVRHVTYIINECFRNFKYNRVMLYGLIVCDIVMIGILLLRLGSLPPQIPLFFSRPWGEDQLVDTWMILILPFLLNILYFINMWIYRRFFPGNEFVKKIIDYLNIFLMVSITFIFVKIITLIS